MDSFFNLLSQGWLGTVVGLIGIILAILFYLRSKRKSKLAFQSDHVSLVGRPGAAFPDEVEIRFSGNTVPRISANTIVIWNCGDQTIRGADLVNKDPLRLEVPDTDRILKFTVLKQTRGVNAWNFDQSNTNKLNLTFDYLDPGDGISLEIIHTASGNDLDVTGTIKGIPKGLHNYGRTFRSVYRRRTNIPFPLRQPRVIFFIAVFLGIVLMLFGLLRPQLELWLPSSFTEQKLTEPRQISWPYAFMGFLYAALPAYLLWSRRKRYPATLEPEEDNEDSE